MSDQRFDAAQHIKLTTREQGCDNRQCRYSNRAQTCDSKHPLSCARSLHAGCQGCILRVWVSFNNWWCYCNLSHYNLLQTHASY